MYNNASNTISSLTAKANCRKPVCRMGILTKRIAARIMTSNGIVAFLTSLLRARRIPQTISRIATTYMISSGAGNGRFRKMELSSLLRSFIVPDVINTNATT